MVGNKLEERSTENKIDSKEGKMGTTEKTTIKVRDIEMTAKLDEIEKHGVFMVGGETNIDDEVIAQIAAVAAKEVEGVAEDMGEGSIRRSLSEMVGSSEKRARGVEVEAGKMEAIIDLTLKVIYGYSIPKIILEVRKNVATRLLEMVGLVAKEINVDVVGIEFPDRMPGNLQ
ncbi:Asp23/Gls24 family envelope stress response protein [Chloroflexota bacterium]